MLFQHKIPYFIIGVGHLLADNMGRNADTFRHLFITFAFQPA